MVIVINDDSSNTPNDLTTFAPLNFWNLAFSF